MQHWAEWWSANKEEYFKETITDLKKKYRTGRKICGLEWMNERVRRRKARKI
jgi:hypothetical protein